MLRGYFKQSYTYQHLLSDPLMVQAFDWLRANPMPTPREDPYSIFGDDLFAIVKQFTPEPVENGRLETHHEYVDLHANFGPLEERILFAKATELTVTEDYPDRDVTFYSTPPDCASLLLKPQQFIIFDTEIDAHMPQRTIGVRPSPELDQTLNLKVVIKLRKNKLTPELKL